MSDDGSSKTYDRALNMLAFRARSEREVRRQLARKGEPAEHIEAAVERLLRVGLLNDFEFARQFARAKLAGPGLSKRRVQTELARKGVAREVVDAAIAEVFTDESVDQEAMIARVAEKKLRSLAKLDPEIRRRRLYAFLARRGYGPDEIRKVMGRE
ncbi:MAG: recombination regulator RecX [Gemmatimonadota bacterium]|nr:recombination regulator RecX [Gemmatimonadota bacterium]